MRYHNYEWERGGHGLSVQEHLSPESKREAYYNVFVKHSGPQKDEQALLYKRRDLSIIHQYQGVNDHGVHCCGRQEVAGTDGRNV
jgi:hypothetical protein